MEMMSFTLSADLFWVSALGLELDELLGYLIVGPLGENAQNGPPGLVEVDPPAEGAPAGARPLLSDVAQLHDGRAKQPVLAREAVVLHANV